MNEDSSGRRSRPDESPKRSSRRTPADPPLWSLLAIRFLVPEDEREFFMGDIHESRQRMEGEDARGASPLRVGMHYSWLREVLGAAALRFSGTGRRGSNYAHNAKSPKHNRQWSRKVDRMVAEFFSDLKFGLRMIFRNPGFTLVALVTMALGIGANSALFSVAHGVLFRPLPYHEPGRLVDVGVNSGVDPANDFTGTSEPEFIDIAAGINSFDQVAAYSGGGVTIGDSLSARRVQVMRVTTNLFSVLGVRPLLGRFFSPEDGSPDASGAIILSHGMWRQEFGGDSSVIGRSVDLHDFSATFGAQYDLPVPIVGVMPPAFEFPDAEYEAWVPLHLDRQDPNTRSFHYLHVLARLKAGTRLEAAQSEVNLLAARSTAEYPGVYPADPGYNIRLQPYRTRIVGHVAAPLYLLMGAAGFVLLTACVNVANLLLARGEARKCETAIRTALGATAGSIMRQHLIEHLILVAAGGVAGFGIAVVGVNVIRVVASSSVPRLDQVGVVAPVLGLTIVVAVGTGIVFGILPPLRNAGAAPQHLIKEGGGTSKRSRQGLTFRRLLIVSEVAFAVVLTIGAGLMLRSIRAIHTTDIGFQTENILSFRLYPPSNAYEDGEASVTLYKDLIGQLETLPGVTSSGAVFWLPLASSPYNMSVDIEDRPAESVSEAHVPDMQFVTPGFFETVGTPLIRGRLFNERDDANSPLVVVISERMAMAGWRGADPIGRRMRMFGWPWMEVIGVVKDVHQYGVTQEPRAAWYVPHTQGYVSAFISPPDMTVLVHTDPDYPSVVGTVRDAVATFDRRLVVSDIQTMKDVFGATVTTERLVTILLSVFGILALSLAMVGVYGLISLSVSQKTHEIGLRMALGARSTTVLVQAIREGMLLTLAGVALGLVGCIALARGIEALVFGVTATDPLTYGSVVLLLVIVAAAASLIPARRASQVDPMVALRAVKAR